MYQYKLSIMTVKPVDSQYFLPGTDSTDIGEEMLVMCSRGEGELGKYLSSVHQTAGKSYLYLCFWHSVVGSEGGLTSETEIRGDNSV